MGGRMGVTLKDGEPAELPVLREVKKELEELRKGAYYTRLISIIAIIVSIAFPLFNFIV
jgi:hypothetical protein